MKTTGDKIPSGGVRICIGSLALVALLTLFSVLALADDPTVDEHLQSLASMSLEELGDLEIDITAKEEEKAKEAFNIVSVVTREDIRQAHCRDIAEVLQLVPGFNIVHDVTYVSLSVRGLYGFEGRVLFMVNQIPVSDLLFGGFPLNNHIPISTIKRVEVIRGPGSILHGGIAELSVVNIVTDQGEDIQGARVSGRGGQYVSGVGLRSGSFEVGDEFKDGQYSLVLSRSKGRRSDGINRQFDWMPSYRHNDDSAGERTDFVAAQASYRGLSAKFIYDGLHVNRVYPTDVIPYEDAESAIQGRRYQETFRVIGGAVSHESALTDKIQLFNEIE